MEDGRLPPQGRAHGPAVEAAPSQEVLWLLYYGYTPISTHCITEQDALNTYPPKETPLIPV